MHGPTITNVLKRESRVPSDAKRQLRTAVHPPTAGTLRNELNDRYRPERALRGEFIRWLVKQSLLTLSTAQASSRRKLLALVNCFRFGFGLLPPKIGIAALHPARDQPRQLRHERPALRPGSRLHWPVALPSFVVHHFRNLSKRAAPVGESRSGPVSRSAHSPRRET